MRFLLTFCLSFFLSNYSDHNFFTKCACAGDHEDFVILSSPTTKIENPSKEENETEIIIFSEETYKQQLAQYEQKQKLLQKNLFDQEQENKAKKSELDNLKQSYAETKNDLIKSQQTNKSLQDLLLKKTEEIGVLKNQLDSLKKHKELSIEIKSTDDSEKNILINTLQVLQTEIKNITEVNQDLMQQLATLKEKLYIIDKKGKK
jgi:hypothetical protein